MLRRGFFSAIKNQYGGMSGGRIYFKTPGLRIINNGKEMEKNLQFISRDIKIYTKTGDKGFSSLFSGERRAKSDNIFNALGGVDELNANIGLSIDFLVKEMNEKDELKDNQVLGEIIEQMKTIQMWLLDMGSCIATPPTSASDSKIKRVMFDSNGLTALEEWIDKMDERLPPLKNFILPSGGLAASQTHIARTVCRRTERICSIVVENEVLDPTVLKFINRLSDYLFMTARSITQELKNEETIYKKPQKKK